MKKIAEEYEKLRIRRSDEKRERVNEVYFKYPEIKKIDKTIYELGAENVKNIIKSPSDADTLNSEYKKKFEKLKSERKKMIEENGIDPQFDSIKYDCEKCRDTGFTDNGERCVCFRKKLIKYRYSKSNLSENLERENFEFFSFDYYSKEKPNGVNVSPFENMKKIYDRAVNFCDNFDNEKKGLVFYGGTGLGKTFLSSCIAKRLMDNGKTVIYMRASRLFSMYEEYRFNRLEDEDMINDIYSADLLIIDDLGTEAQTKNNMSFLFELINERINTDKKIIINTNYSMTELTKIYSQRLTSRIYEHFLVYGFYGEDIRILKLKNGL